MNRFWRMTAALAVGLAFLASTAGADTPDPVDTSLTNEVENYLATATPAAADEAMTFRVFFKNGINLESGDGNFSMKIGGRLMNDWFWITSDDYDSSITEDGTFFRRVRLFMSGDVYKNVTFKVQIDFAGGEEGAPDLKDVYVGLKKIGPFALKVGHFKEPFSLEELTSSKYITFIERSGPTNAFAPSRNTGLALSTTVANDRVDIAFGIFRTTEDDGAAREDGGYSFTLRIAGIAMENKDEGTLVHVGFGFSLRDPPGETARFRARFGPGTGDRLVDTGSLAADDVTLINFELAVVWKSFSAQAEYFMASVGAPSGGTDVDVGGFYIQISWWATGESRHYKKFKFDRVKPNKNFHGGGEGWGAIEIAYRFESIDLTDGTVVTGGEQTVHVFGVNWHWNPNTRTMFNYFFADTDPDSDGNNFDVSGFIVRFQFDF